MTDSEICGSTDTTSGDPCQITGDCPHHGNSNGWPGLLERREEDLLEAARRGKSKVGCARSAGVGESTLYEWLDRFPKFSEGFMRARAEGEDRLVDAVADKDPKFILERSYGYTKRQEIDHRHEDAVPIDAPSSVLRIEDSDSGDEE